MKSPHTLDVTGVTILRDGRWPTLKEALESVLYDKRLKKIIIVSSDTQHKNDLALFAKMYKGKVIFSEEDVTFGRAALFSKAFLLAQKQETDYVLFLDDDAIPEENIIDVYFENFKYLKNKAAEKSILIANTIDIFGKEKSFYNSIDKKSFKDGTLFDLFNIKKIKNILKHALHIETTPTYFSPIFKTQAFIGGGVLIPMEALRSVELPDASLYMYGEDTDYAWKLREAGYDFYQCLSPIIRRPSSEESKKHHVFGLFAKETPDHEVYYHLRNAVLISRKHTQQNKPILFINILAWITGALILGFWHADSFPFFFHRTKLIITAVIHGYCKEKKYFSQ